MKVLVTGSLGQLGRELLYTPWDDYDICAVDVSELDITAKDGVMSFVKDFAPEVIINAAAYTAVDKAESEEQLAYNVNCVGAANLAAAANSVGARLIHISTDYVFDGTNCRPYLPQDKTNPISAYGRTKLAGERAVAEALDDYVIIRTSWLYSAHGGNFVKTMLRLMDERDELGVVADQIGTPTSARMLADVVWKFVERRQLGGVYHYSDAGAASWYDFAYMIMDKAFEIGLLDNTIDLKPIATADYPTAAKRPAYSVFDKTDTYRDLELEPCHWLQPLTDVLYQIKGNR